jgi:hypothetical protein
MLGSYVWAWAAASRMMMRAMARCMPVRTRRGNKMVGLARGFKRFGRHNLQAMGEIVKRKLDETGIFMRVGIGKKTVTKVAVDPDSHKFSNKEYDLMVKAGVPVAKIYRVVDYQFPGSEAKEPVIVQQKADTIPSAELIKHAPDIAKIIHTAAENHLQMIDFNHLNLGLVDSLEPENKGQKVVVRDTSAFVRSFEEIPKNASPYMAEAMKQGVDKLKERTVEQEVRLLGYGAKHDIGSEEAEKLKAEVLKHLRLLEKKEEA